jgi:hypothetical protein
MKPMFRRVVALTAIALLAVGVADATPAAKKITWQTDFKKASALAKKSGKIMMLDFYTDW